MVKMYLQYKGYYAKFEYDSEDKIFYGWVLGIGDSVNFHAESEEKCHEEFHKAVDDYICFCKKIGKEPQKCMTKLSNFSKCMTKNQSV